MRETIVKIATTVDYLAESQRRIERQIGSLATQKDVDRLEERVEKLESDRTWAFRLILGGVALAFLTFALSGGLSPP